MSEHFEGHQPKPAWRARMLFFTCDWPRCPTTLFNWPRAIPGSATQARGDAWGMTVPLRLPITTPHYYPDYDS